MKTLRIWLLVLLAALLPVRGALAAAMMCPPVAATGTMHHSEGMQHDGLHEAHVHGAHDDAQGAQHHDTEPAPSGPQDKCNVCAASCSVTPLPSGFVAAPAPVDLDEAAFPDLRVPAPSFLSGRQERPPRSI
ncbi:MAG TPA: hypothetical protein VGD46_06020 [Rhizobacter sp.]